MDLKELNYFLKIAEYENITRAAAELHVAQPHLTRQIHALEEELGVSLFIRKKKRIYITDEGKFLKRQAEQILGLVNKTEEQIREMGEGLTGTLYIGAIETVGTLYLPNWISDFKEAYPNVKYNLWSGNSTDVIERLERGLLDLALVREPFDTDKYDSLHVEDEDWIVLLNENHPLAAQEDHFITLEELSKEELMVPTQRIEEVTQWFRKKDLKENIICGFSPLMNAIVMAERNLGVAILPESCRFMLGQHKVVIRRLSDKKSSGVSFVWNKGYTGTAAASRFLEFVRMSQSVHTQNV